MNKEQVYTSTATKLFNHLNRLKSIRDYNKWYPINIQLCPTNKCNLNCDYCSVSKRDKTLELKWKECKEIIDKFNEVGALSLEISGGGEPTLYPKINELIDYGYYSHLNVGMISNGLRVKDYLDKDSLNRLMWLRISLSAFDFGMDIDIPKIKGSLAFSYVWYKDSKPRILDKIYEYANKYKSEVVRIVPDCLHPYKQMIYRDQVKKIVEEKGYGDKIFVQTKNYNVHSICYLGGLKPCVYTDGYVYHCTATALYNRDFGKKWRICHYKDIKKIWPDNFKPLIPKMCKVGKCFYSEHNKLLDDLQVKVPHYGFI